MTMRVFTCRACGGKFTRPSGMTGRPSAHCQACRDRLETEYHARYDAAPEQMERRRQYYTRRKQGAEPVQDV